MTTFTFKPGPVMPEQTWRCEAGRLSGPSGDSIDFRQTAWRPMRLEDSVSRSAQG